MAVFINIVCEFFLHMILFVCGNEEFTIDVLTAKLHERPLGEMGGFWILYHLLLHLSDTV